MRDGVHPLEAKPDVCWQLPIRRTFPKDWAGFALAFREAAAEAGMPDYTIESWIGLVSVAGTHVVSAAYQVGALGNVHTAPAYRGRGLAALVTAAVVQDLRALGASTVVLNIVATNTPARRVYERIGFREYCVYHEGHATR